MKDGEPIGCAWAAAVPLSLRHLAIHVGPAPGEWCTYGVHILACHTGSVSAGRAMQGALMRDARDAGVETITGHVNLGNRFNRIVRRLGGWGKERTFAIVLFNRRSVPLWRHRLEE